MCRDSELPDVDDPASDLLSVSLSEWLLADVGLGPRVLLCSTCCGRWLVVLVVRLFGFFFLWPSPLAEHFLFGGIAFFV